MNAIVTRIKCRYSRVCSALKGLRGRNDGCFTFGLVSAARILGFASGNPTKSEQLGLGEEEFVSWLIGAVM